MTRVRLCAFALAAALAFGAAAQDAALPPVNTQGAISYLSGGIGADESAAIKAAQANYPLSITFSSRSADRDVYLADVPVTVRNASGETVLDLTTDGPFLLVDLPPGRYEVTATWRGLDRTATASIATGRNQKLSFVWQGGEPVPPSPVVPTPVTPTPAASIPAAPTSATPTRAPVPSPAETAAAAAASASATQGDLPAINTQGGIPYLSGGIGATESAAIKAAAPRYSLSVTFTRVEGTRNVYLATIPVKVLDKSGSTVLDLVTDGPFLLADLPPGDYRVVASYQGTQKQGVAKVVAGKPAKVTLVWPTAPSPPAR